MPALVQNMGVHHGRSYIRVSQEFLDRPDVVALLPQVRGKGVSQRVATAGLKNSEPSE